MEDCNLEIMRYQIDEMMKAKDRQFRLLMWVGGLAFASISGLMSYSGSISKDLTIATTQVEAMKQEVEKLRKVDEKIYQDISTVQDWTDNNFVRKN